MREYQWHKPMSWGSHTISTVKGWVQCKKSGVLLRMLQLLLWQNIALQAAKSAEQDIG